MKTHERRTERNTDSDFPSLSQMTIGVTVSRSSVRGRVSAAGRRVRRTETDAANTGKRRMRESGRESEHIGGERL